MSGPPPISSPPIFQTIPPLDPSKPPTGTATSTTRRRTGPAYLTTSSLLGGGQIVPSSSSSSSSSSLSVPPTNNDTNLTNGPPLGTDHISPPLTFNAVENKNSSNKTSKLNNGSSPSFTSTAVHNIHTSNTIPTPWTLPPPLTIPSLVSEIPPVVSSSVTTDNLRSPSIPVSPPFTVPAPFSTSNASTSSSSFTTPTAVIPPIATKSNTSVASTPSPLQTVASTLSQPYFPSSSSSIVGASYAPSKSMTTTTTVSTVHGGIPLPLSSSSSTTSALLSSSQSSTRFPSGADLVKSFKPTPFAETQIGKSTLASVRSRRSSMSGNSSVDKQSTSSLIDQTIEQNNKRNIDTVSMNGVLFTQKNSLSAVPTPVTTKTEAPVLWPQNADPESIANIIQKREDTLKANTRQQIIHNHYEDTVEYVPSSMAHRSDDHHHEYMSQQPLLQSNYRSDGNEYADHYNAKVNANTTQDDFIPPSLSLDQLNDTLNSTISRHSLDTGRIVVPSSSSLPSTVQTVKPTVEVRKTNIPVIKVQETTTASMFFTGVNTNQSSSVTSGSTTFPTSSVTNPSSAQPITGTSTLPSHQRKSSSFTTTHTTNKDIFDKPPQPPNYAVIKAETTKIKDPASAFFGASPGYTPVALPLPSTTVIVSNSNSTIEQPASFFSSGNADNGPSSLARFGVHVRTVSGGSARTSGSSTVPINHHTYRTRTNSSRLGNHHIGTKSTQPGTEEAENTMNKEEDDDTNISSTVVSTSELFANAPSTALDTLFSVPALVHQSPHQRYDNSYMPGFAIPPPLSPSGTHTYGGIFSQYPVSPVIPRSAMDFFATVLPPSVDPPKDEAVVPTDQQGTEGVSNDNYANQEGYENYSSAEYSATTTNTYNETLYPEQPPQHPSEIYNGYYNDERVWISYDPYTEYPNGSSNDNNNYNTYGSSENNNYNDYTEYNSSLYADTENGAPSSTVVEPWNRTNNDNYYNNPGTTMGNVTAEPDGLANAMDFFAASTDTSAAVPGGKNTEKKDVPSKVAPWETTNNNPPVNTSTVATKKNAVAPWEMGTVTNNSSVENKSVSSATVSTTSSAHVAPWDIGKAAISATHIAALPSVTTTRAPTPPLQGTTTNDPSALHSKAKVLNGPPLSSHTVAPLHPSLDTADVSSFSESSNNKNTNPFTAVPSASLPSSKASKSSRSGLAKGYVPTPFGSNTFNPTETSNKHDERERSLSPVISSLRDPETKSSVSSVLLPPASTVLPKGPRGPHKPTLSANFGFGGRLVVFSNTSTKVHLYNVGDILEHTSIYQSVKAFPGPLLQNGTPKKIQDYLSHQEEIEMQRWKDKKTKPDRDLAYLSIYPLGLCGRSSPLHDLQFLHTILNLLVKNHGIIPVQGLVTINSSNGNTNIGESTNDCTEDLRKVLQFPTSSFVPEWIDHPSLATAIVQAMAVSPVLGISSFPSSSPSPTGTSTPDPARIQKMEQALINGNKSLALEEAISLQLWSHALLIAATISKESYQRTVMAFTITNIPFTSSLTSLYPALAGDVFPLSLPPLPPTATIMDPNNSEHLSRTLLLRNWRVHFLTLLQNQLLVDPRLLVNLGDRLWIEGGSVYSAHSLYLLAGVTTPEPPNAHARIVLIGADHRQHPGTFLRDIPSLQRTEILEYARYNPKANTNPMLMMMPSIQPIKLMYALVLADLGLVQEAFVYVQSIRKCIQQCIGTNVSNPERWFQAVLQVGFNPMFLTELDVFEDRLRQTNRIKISSTETKSNVGLVTGAVGTAFSGIKRLFSGNSTESSGSSVTMTAVNNLSRRNSKDIGVAPGTNIAPTLTTNTAVTTTTMVTAKSEKTVGPDSLSTVNASNTNPNLEINNAGTSSGIFSSIRGIFGRNSTVNGKGTEEETKPVKRVVQLGGDRSKQPYYDEQKKRWVIPGEEEAVENNVPLGPPPTATTTSATSNVTTNPAVVTNNAVVTDDNANNTKTKKKASRYFDPLAATSGNSASSTINNNNNIANSNVSALPPRYPNATSSTTNNTSSVVTPMMFTPPPSSSVSDDSNAKSMDTLDNTGGSGGGFGPAFQANSRLLQQAVNYNSVPSVSTNTASLNTNPATKGNNSKTTTTETKVKTGKNGTTEGTLPTISTENTTTTSSSMYDNFNFGASFSVGATASFGTRGTNDSTNNNDKNDNIWEF